MEVKMEFTSMVATNVNRRHILAVDKPFSFATFIVQF